ncbi:GNAT family N-acetyltransferase [Micromonospora arborensis]|uniref:GNAT family N-acetyltransferase n=1 Tax=Micromonospora arborensis TaxID=2116518 RepID=UPI0033D3AE41
MRHQVTEDHMAKPRSSRARRKQPVRLPIPSNRLTASSITSRCPEFGEHDLTDDPPDSSAVRIRLAGRNDMPIVRGLSTLAGVNLDEEIVEAVNIGIAGAALRAGFDGGRHAFMEHMAEQVYVNQRRNQARTVQHTVLVLVAEHEQHGIVGALVAYPPTNVIDQVIDHARASGASGEQLMRLFCSGVMSLVRIKAIAVTESQRGLGIGGSLLRRCWQIYERSGYMMIFGQSDDTAGLQRFFHRHGFEFLKPDIGFDSWVIFGVHVDVRPDIGCRTFIWRRRDNRRAATARPSRRAARVQPPEPDTSRPPHEPVPAAAPPRQRPPLVEVGVWHLLLAANEDPRRAPLLLLAAAAWQAGRHATGDGRARLHYCVAAGLHHLGFSARVMSAQVIAWREDQPQSPAQTIGADLSEPSDQRAGSKRHTVVWTESFAQLLDVVVFHDAAVRGLAADGRQELLAFPPMLPLPDFEPFTTSAAAPAVHRGPITIAWNLGCGGADSHHEGELEKPAAQRGGRILADATLDVLLAAASYVDLEPMLAQFPHLRALMVRRENALWSPAASR